MPDAEPSDPTEPFYLIVADHDRHFFSVEGPMTDDRPWQAAALHARARERYVICGPRGTDPATLAAEYRGLENMTGVPPGSIIRPRA